MPRYANLSGDSGVIAYRIHAESIDVTFGGGAEYRYSYAMPGREHVEAMKRLAAAGRGLSTYISVHVRERYARKLR